MVAVVEEGGREGGGGGGNRGRVSKAGCPFAYAFRATWTRDGAMMIFNRWIEIKDAKVAADGIGTCCGRRLYCRSGHLFPSYRNLSSNVFATQNFYSLR